MGNWQQVVSMAGLSVRATNVLLRNFSSCEKFLASDEETLMELRNCGRKTVRELLAFRDRIVRCNLGQAGLKLPTPPKTAEETLRLPPAEENLLSLPVFSSKPVIGLTIADLHPGYRGDAPLKDFVFSIRVSKILKNLALETIGEVMLFPAGELLSQKNFGRKCLKEVQDIIRSFILSGGMLQSTAAVNVLNKGPHEIDFSSYKSLVAGFVGQCLKSKRNQEIVCNRLNFHGPNPTLERLGERFGVSRERVRQILKRGNALLRKRACRALLNDFWESVYRITCEGGGIISLQDLSLKLQEQYNWPDSPGPAALAELLSVGEEERKFSVSGNMATAPCSCLTCQTPQEFLPTLDFEENESFHLLVAGEKLVRFCLEKQCGTADRLRQFHQAFLEKMIADSGGVYQLHGELIFPYGRWLIRHGERLEDLIIHVLENHGKPMHFSEIAGAIRKENIKYREISDHNVHSAMLRYDSIEIVRRGTYGLKAWGCGGYRSVSTAIEELLDSHDLPMRRRDIITHLQGEFSETNISAALHNWGNRFVSIGEGFYDRPERWRKRSVAEYIEMLPAPVAELARFVTTNNNCSYKMVLALVFFRGMDEKGSCYLPTLKERFYNFYLGRFKKGEVVEAEKVLMRRIGEIEPAEIRNKATVEPLKSFSNSAFWQRQNSSLYLREDLVALLSDPQNHNLLLITLLRAIADYFSVFSPPRSAYPVTGVNMMVRVCDSGNTMRENPVEAAPDDPGGSVATISIKKKGRNKISL